MKKPFIVKPRNLIPSIINETTVTYTLLQRMENGPTGRLGARVLSPVMEGYNNVNVIVSFSRTCHRETSARGPV